MPTPTRTLVPLDDRRITLEFGWDEFGPDIREEFPVAFGIDGAFVRVHLTDRSALNYHIKEWFGEEWKEPWACPHGHGLHGVEAGWYYHHDEPPEWVVADEGLLFCEVCSAEMEEIEP